MFYLTETRLHDQEVASSSHNKQANVKGEEYGLDFVLSLYDKLLF